LVVQPKTLVPEKYPHSLHLLHLLHLLHHLRL
jgi:hypothetical protein